MRKGFTLAEVLITLGIIGVVAALTIPTLISNYKTKEASVRLKKFYSMMNQAIQLSTLDNGQTSTWTYPGTLADTDSLETFWNVYFAPYLRIADAKADSFQYNTDSDGNPMVQDMYKIYFQDGSTLAMRASGAVDMHYDVNGESAPNEIGRDIHLFLMYRTGKFTPYQYNKDLGEDNDKYNRDFNDRANVLVWCKNIDAAYCTQLLFLDNWEFKDDYPYKL